MNSPVPFLLQKLSEFSKRGNEVLPVKIELSRFSTAFTSK
jgi:hypothetical protein